MAREARSIFEKENVIRYSRSLVFSRSKRKEIREREYLQAYFRTSAHAMLMSRLDRDAFTLDLLDPFLGAVLRLIRLVVLVERATHEIVAADLRNQWQILEIINKRIAN